MTELRRIPMLPALVRQLFALRILALLLASVPLRASAHAFVQPYSLPVPFYLYAAGSACALVISFIAIAVFSSTPSIPKIPAQDARNSTPTMSRWTIKLGRALAFIALWLSIISGAIGTSNPFQNINMTLFWIWFVLGVPYLAACAGDFYRVINPWRTTVDLLKIGLGISFQRRAKNPLSYFPSFCLYVAFIWLELFGELSPFGLSVALLTYTALNVIGSLYFGIDEWFERGEFFGVFIRQIARMAPKRRRDINQCGRIRWHVPLQGSHQLENGKVALTLFVLFMLSSTAFDGLHATAPWSSVYWKDVYPAIQEHIHTSLSRKYQLSTQIFYWWQRFALVLSPLVYLAVFGFFVALARWSARTTESTMTLINRLAICTLPIALAYHITHYYTLLLMQGGQIFRLVSDPFGFGWNLFKTANLSVMPVMVSAQTLWHSQVAIVLVGHIAGVYLSHVEALRLFGSSRRATVSQLPLLILMVLFTTFGLWIISLPLGTGS